MNAKQFLAFLITGAATSLVAATTYNWKADASGNYSGNFADPDHWNPAIEGGPGSGYPESSANFNQIANYPVVDGDYTVTLPEGVVTNLSTLFLYASYGHKVTFDGSKTTWVMPTVDGNTYGNFEIHSAKLNAQGKPASGPMCFKRYNQSGSANGIGMFKNFTLSLASAWGGVPGTVLELTGEGEWKTDSVRMFTEAPDADGRVEFRFKDGSMANLMKMEFGFANPTNVVTFSNYRADWFSNMSFVPAAGVLANDKPGLFELNYTDGSMITNRPSVNFNQGSILTLGYSGNASQQSYAKTFRVNVDKGSLLSFCNMTISGQGHNEINVKGEGSFLYMTHQTSLSTIGKGTMSTSTVSVVDRAIFKTEGLIDFGDPSSVGEGNLVISNATASFRRRVRLNRGTFRLQDADITLYSGESDNEFAGGGVEGASAELFADGTTIHFTQTRDRTLVSNFTVARLGARGLTLSVESSKNFDVPQNFTDWTTDGTLTTLGRSGYPLVLTGTDSRQSNLIVARETTKLAAGANHYSHVQIRDGATFSLVGGQTAPTLRQLTLGTTDSSGTLALDPGTVITVDGPIAFVNPQILFSSTLGVGTTTVFRQTVKPSDDTVVTWEAFMRGVIGAGLPADKYSRLQVVSSEGAWLYQIVVSDSAPVREGETGWTGSGTSWNDQESWTGGKKPDPSYEAVFGGTDAQTVTVEGVVDAAGIKFGNAAGTTLAGGRIRISDNRDAEIAATTGENEVATQVQMTSRVAVPVAEGATVTVSGEVIGGGFAKSGAGRLVVENEANRMSAGFGLAGGWLEFTTLGALGFVFDSTVSDLASGTLEYTGESGATRVATAVAGPVVIKNESELKMPLPSATAGAIIKRGEGRLVFDVTKDETLALVSSADGGLYVKGDAVAYPEDGSAPEKHSAISVNENELVFRGSGATVPKVSVKSGDKKQTIAVGVPVAEHSGPVGREPGLVIDHVQFECGYVEIGRGLTAGATFANEPYLVITNGGVLSASVTPNAGDSNTDGVRIYADRGTLYSPLVLNAREAVETTNHIVFVNGSVLAGSRHSFHGSTVVTFSNSVWASSYTAGDRSKLGACVAVNYGVKPTALTDWSFADGSIFACSSLDYSAPASSRSNPQTLRFDNSEWWGGAGDRTFATASLNVTTVVSGTGLIQQPGTGETYTWITPIVGEGGFVKRGAGTVRFAPQERYHAVVADDPVTFGYSGLTDIQEGTVAIEPTTVGVDAAKFRIAEGALLDLCGGEQSGFVISGSGTVKNGTLVSPSIAAEDGEAPLLDFANGLDASGRCVIRFADVPAAALGAEVAVARYSGVLPAGVTFRVKGTTADGSPLGGTVRIADGVIYATPEVRGLMILVR